MTEQHPITPPPELIKEWIQEANDGGHDPRWQEYEQDIANRAAQWGADQELKACCKWTTANFGELPGQNLYLFRRPKPPSLKKQMLARTKAILNDPNRILPAEVRETLELNQRALEALPDD